MKRLALLAVLLLMMVGTASAAFNPADYERSVDFFVNSTSAQTDYQINMILDNRTGSATTGIFFTNGTTRSDWADVAWTDTSDNLLGFWPQNRTDTATNNTWWIKVASIASDNTTMIRLHYGNSTITTSYANGEQTFVRHDDFPGTSLNTTIWPATYGSNTISNSEIFLAGGASTGNGISTDTNKWGTNYSFIGRVKYWASPAYDQNHAAGFWDATVAKIMTNTGGVPGSETYKTAQEKYSLSGVTDGVYHVFDIRKTPASIKFYVDGSLITTHTSQVPTVTQKVMIVASQAATSAKNITVDWGAIRKYTTNEPFLTLAPSDEIDPPVASFTCDHSLVRIPHPVTCTDTSTNDPDEWLWDFGDGTTSTDQNPTHYYTKRGEWAITLTATNAGGSDESDPNYVKVIGYEIYT